MAILREHVVCIRCWNFSKTLPQHATCFIVETITLIHAILHSYLSPASALINLLGLTYSAMPSSWRLGEFLGRRS